MSKYRKIQIALGTILLWSSTSVSSFAYTNTITPGKFQSDTVKLPVESLPSRQLNLTPDTNLIAGEIRDRLSVMGATSHVFERFDAVWRQHGDRKTNFFGYCQAQRSLPVGLCFSYLVIWLVDSVDNYKLEQDFTDLENILDGIMKMRRFNDNT